MPDRSTVLRPGRRRMLGAGAVGVLALTAAACHGIVITRSGGGAGGATGTGAADVAGRVDPALVDIVSTLGLQNDQAAGTGIVLTSTGRVLTNNHVISGATSISATDVGNGATYQATVVGYDRTDDLAVLQLSGASGLRTATLGSSASATVREPVTAIGNAGGTGGTPSAAPGSVTALNQSITASDQVSGSTEQLHGLIQTNANVQPGDSGGPLVDNGARVIGIDTAATTGYRFQTSGGGYAIPIDTADAAGSAIAAGRSSDTVHIGPTALLGVDVESVGGVTGAEVAEVVQDTPAANTGLTAGDAITALDGASVTSPTDLTSLLDRHHPGDTVTVTWVDRFGGRQSAAVQLATGPAG